MENNHQETNNYLLYYGSKKRNQSQVSLSPSPTLLTKPRKPSRMTSPVAMQPLDSNSNVLSQEWKDLSMDEKLDRLMLRLLTLDDLKSNVNSIIEERETQVGNELLLKKIATLEGKKLMLEKKVEVLSAKLEDIEWREMRDNVIFYNVEESKGEDCHLVIENLLTEEMNVLGQHIYSTGNITGEVRIDVAHRIGKLGPNPRPIVAKFVTRQGKEYVMKHKES